MRHKRRGGSQPGGWKKGPYSLIGNSHLTYKEKGGLKWPKGGKEGSCKEGKNLKMHWESRPREGFCLFETE